MTLRVMLDPDGSQAGWMYVVVAARTGVTYLNQCAGLVCEIREIEGYLVPVGGLKTDPELGVASPAELTALFHPNNGLTAGLARLRSAVSEIPFWVCGSEGDRRESLQLDEHRVGEVVEAWVPVITPLGRGILVWENSD
ncbi:MAG: DUF6210 family protein [Myxococcota bacterium]